jgi:Cu2+-exporting ATPase
MSTLDVQVERAADRLGAGTASGPARSAAPPAPPAAGSCAHCGLPVPAPAERFCCGGCAAVWEAIHACGFDRYYILRDEARAPRRLAAADRARDDAHAELDDPRFLELHARILPHGRRAAALAVEGMHCGACVWLLERMPAVLPGVVQTRVDLRRGLLHVVWDESRIGLARVARQVERFGYRARARRGARTAEARRREDRRRLVSIAVAGAAAGNAMVIAFALYGGMLHGMEAAHRDFLRVASAILALLAVAWPGRVFFQGALAALRTRTPHMDLPVALGLSVGLLSSLYRTASGTGEVYFETVTVLVFLLLVGRFIQLRQQRASLDSVEMLDGLAPRTARRIENGAATVVPPEALRVGDRIEVRPGECVPADGRVLEGASLIDAALLSGESRPVAAEAGARVHAGTVNVSRPLLIEVETAGEDTRLGRLMGLVERCAGERAPVVRLADRVAGVFVVVVVLLALLTVIAWWRVDPARGLESAISLLIITCPCALGMATPLAFMAAIGRAARRGMLIKGGESLERLSGKGLIVLDKTGTLTHGRMSVVEWRGSDALRVLAASAEQASSHPVARALVASVGARALAAAQQERETPGGGVEAVVDGQRVHVGSARFMRAAGIEPGAWVMEEERRLAGAGLTPVMVAVDGVVGAVGGCGDALKDDAAESIEAMRGLGWEVTISSGDHPSLVQAAGRGAGLASAECAGGVSPEEKVAAVKAAVARRTVVMVGDGVNDAAALAAASVGVAVRGGAEASLAAADVYVAAPGLAPVVELLRGARRTMGVVRSGLAISLVYNVLGASLAMAGLINPIVAAVLMPLSSLTVIGLACRARSFGGAACR